MNTAHSHPSFVRYRQSHLYGVPSCHNRLVFARYVRQACHGVRPTIVAVELPRSFLDSGGIDLVRQHAPGIGLIVVKTGKMETVVAPASPAVNCRQTRRTRAPIASLVLPVTPADSMIEAIRITACPPPTMQDWKPELVCIDDEPTSDTDYPKPLPLTDDYWAVRNGLEEYWAQPLLAGGKTCRAFDRRNRVMASRLRMYMQAGERVLWVGGAAHWEPMCRHLDADIRGAWPSQPSLTTGRPVFIGLPARVGFVMCYLDDGPYLVSHYERIGRSDMGGTFDKLAAVDQLIAKAVAAAQDTGLPVSLARLEAFYGFVQRQLCASGRFVPLLGDHLLRSAEACVGRRFAETLKELALRFPWEDASGTMFARQPDGRILLGRPDNAILLDMGLRGSGRNDDEDDLMQVEVELQRLGNGKGSRFCDFDGTELSPSERESLRKSPLNVVPSSELLFSKRCCDQAREAAHRPLAETFARPWQGDLGLGIDVRRTLRARLAGNQEVYVRQMRRPRSPGLACDRRCPVVFVFDHQAEVVSKISGTYPYGRRGINSVLSAVYWYSRRTHLGATGVTRSNVAWSVVFYRNSAPYDLDRAVAEFDSLPLSRLPLVDPWYDSELEPFRARRHELAVAAAIKHAADHICLVAAREVPVGAEIRRFAAARNVAILRVYPGDIFEPHAWERLGIDHEVPRAADKHAPLACALRYVLPI